jgi:pimeloyl-ACP methyl ester carboxylesterase
MKDLSKLTPVKPDQGKAQWVEGQVTGIAKDEPKRTHLIGIPPLMPCTTIFVHGVNSDGEWYDDAMKQFCKGLNQRLGRTDLKPAAYIKSQKRFASRDDNGRLNSPILPFYWGYKVPLKLRIKLVDHQRTADRPDAWADRFGNPLRLDGSWSGGPFQNGTHNLLQFWQGGFDKTIGPLSLNLVNPIVGRTLNHGPERTYYVHAARRLAHLVATLRGDFPDEPVNIVAHSQGTMIALCALFYLKQQGVRGPDTVILNSSPYRFDTLGTDAYAAANGERDVQSEESRVTTFRAAAAIVKEARTTFAPRPAPDAECTHQPVARHACDDRIFIHHPPGDPDWHINIGASAVDAQGRHWWESPLHRRDDTRGTLFVNFNPGDRVIGVKAVAGMGWSGIPTNLLDEGQHLLGDNVMQRIFARGSNEAHNRPVGQDSGYRQPFYYEEPVRLAAGATAADGTRRNYLDAKPGTQWKVASERVMGLSPVLGSLGGGGNFVYSYINAPKVPMPAVLGDDFDGVALRYDGQAQSEQDGRPATAADPEQQADYEDETGFEPSMDLETACTPQTVSYIDERGMHCKRLETFKEVELRRREQVGRQIVSPTNHAAILRYASAFLDSSPVRQVLSHDLTVGPGYAFGDEAYWNYLLDLADWKKSDPYYTAGSDGMDATGGTLTEASGIEHAPPGIDRRTVAPAFEPRREAGDT